MPALGGLAFGIASGCVGPEPAYTQAEGGAGSGAAGATTATTGGGGATPEPQPNGEPCAGPTDCESGFCPDQDQVCCDKPCNASCEACVMGKTESPSGTCALVIKGQDSDGDCDDIDPTCMLGGSGCFACDGAGVCRVKNGGPCGTHDMCISNSCSFPSFPSTCNPE